jgi:hypothetical protein
MLGRVCAERKLAVIAEVKVPQREEGPAPFRGGG